MRKLLQIGGVVLLALVLSYAAAVTGQARGQLMMAVPDDIPQNNELLTIATAIAKPAYAVHCAACHGQNMQGDTNIGVPDLADSEWLYGSGRVTEIERTILYGVRSGLVKSWNLADMPGFGRPVPYDRYKVDPLTPGEIRDVVEFLLITSGREGDAEAGERGSQIFSDKGQCFDCHSDDALGDEAIGAPNLVDNIWLYSDGSRQSITNSIKNGIKGHCPAWITRLPALTIRALAVYIHSVSHKSTPIAGQIHAKGLTNPSKEKS